MLKGSRYFLIPTPLSSATPSSAAPARALTAADAEDDTKLLFPRPPELSPRDWAVFLLHSAAEVEHALMIQYLFAAYSLKNPASTVGRTLLTVAREEMGHLLTVQNVLRLMGAPLCFDREDFPVRSKLYPFPFHLEALTKGSLAKYLFTEMSEGDIPEEQLPAEERKEIEKRAREAVQANGGEFINHIGTLYQTLIATFQRDLTEKDIDMSAANAEFEAANWRGTNARTTDIRGMKLIPVKTLKDAIAALEVIGQQGEMAKADDMADSHFERFLATYRALPEDTSDLVHPIGRDPHTGLPGERDGSAIIDPLTRRWAQLFNIRYRVLLVCLMHYMAVSEQESKKRTMLKEWSLEEMRGGTDELSGVNSLAIALATMPLGDGSQGTAGAPFELPYSLSLPDTEAGRWRLHRDLANASAALIADLRKDEQDSDRTSLLDGLILRDGASEAEGRRKVIKDILESLSI